ncbi:MAG: hypothetical protein ACFFD4_04315 [Candidatus Odinarchaeota archaeon]
MFSREFTVSFLLDKVEHVQQLSIHCVPKGQCFSPRVHRTVTRNRSRKIPFLPLVVYRGKAFHCRRKDHPFTESSCNRSPDGSFRMLNAASALILARYMPFRVTNGCLLYDH